MASGPDKKKARLGPQGAERHGARARERTRAVARARSTRLAELVGIPAVSTLALAACGSSPAVAPSALSDRAAIAPAKANPVTVSPMPGSADASPSTQISFLGEQPIRVLRVSVVGSASGAHRGTLRTYSTGTGESFLPHGPFAPGEHVRVRAIVRSRGSTRTASSTFTIAHPANVGQGEFPHNPGNRK